MTRLGHSATCRCGDCGIEATRRRIAELECDLGLCDHRSHPPKPPEPSARPERFTR